MKSQCILSTILLIIIMSQAESQNIGISIAQIARFDSLLAHSQTQTLDSLIQTYSPIVSAEPNLLNWDSVRTKYSEILLQMAAGRSDPSAARRLLTEGLLRNASHYTKEDAGALAAAAYDRSTEMFRRDEVDSAHSEYVIARYFRFKYIDEETFRLLRNADEAAMLIGRAHRKLIELRQERLDTGNVPEIAEISRLCSLYEAENRQTTAFKVLSPRLDPRYEEFNTDLQEIVSQRKRERESGFKEIHYAFSVSGGSFYSTGEFYPPYDLIVKMNDGTGNIVDASISFAHAESDPPPRIVYFGETVMAGVAMYLRDNLTIEMNCSYSRIDRERPLVHPWLDKSFVIPGYSSPITYTSMCVMTDYLLRVKTGFRPLTGLGLNYSIANAPESNSVHDIYYDGVFVSTPLGITQAIRLLFRSGVEYLPSEESSLSYSVLIDASLNLKSSQAIASLLIQSQLRISWLH